MRLNGRRRIAIAVAGAAGAAALGAGGVALADPPGDRTELRIVNGHGEGRAAHAGYTADGDCPWDGAGPARVADDR